MELGLSFVQRLSPDKKAFSTAILSGASISR
jgi:hypothetical protein